MDYRLKKQKQFDEVFHKGKRAFTKRLTLIYLKKNELKIGVSVGKKHGKAVERNRVKRLIRAAYGPLIKRLSDYHIVILPKVGGDYSFQGFSKDLNYLFLKEKLFCESNSDGADKVL